MLGRGAQTDKIFSLLPRLSIFSLRNKFRAELISFLSNYQFVGQIKRDVIYI